MDAIPIAISEYPEKSIYNPNVYDITAIQAIPASISVPKPKISPYVLLKISPKSTFFDKPIINRSIPATTLSNSIVRFLICPSISLYRTIGPCTNFGKNDMNSAKSRKSLHLSARSK